MTGFCVGGSLATIAACWAALQSPTSDVRCITFGAPHVGNAAFVEAFRFVSILLITAWQYAMLLSSLA